MKCQQVECDVDATGRIYWPGREPTLVCSLHHSKALAIAEAMGFHLHTEWLDPNFDPSPGGSP